jgi:hypothetical protein
MRRSLITFHRIQSYYIDQLDLALGKLDIDMQQYLVELATESYNSKVYAIVICVSHPEVYDKIAKLNGRYQVKFSVQDRFKVGDR